MLRKILMPNPHDPLGAIEHRGPLDITLILKRL